jgi:hypothetical protein
MRRRERERKRRQESQRERRGRGHVIRWQKERIIKEKEKKGSLFSFFRRKFQVCIPPTV